MGRLPISMISLGIVLLETSKGVSYGVAGTIAASFAVAAAIGGPVVSGFVDRHGQHRILPLAVAAYTVFMVGLLVSLDMASSLWLVIPLAVGAGMMMPNFGSLVRARWAYVLPGSDGIHVAYAWESILDEVVFVIGPPLATVLALHVHPTAALIVCVLLVLVGTAWLVPQRRTEPAPHGRSKRIGRLTILQPGMPLVVFADTSRMEIQIEVPTRLVSALSEGAQLKARLDRGKEPVSVTVSRIFPMANMGGHTTTVKVALPDGSGARAGMYAEVLVPDPSNDQFSPLTIPATAISWRGSLPTVFLVSPDRTELRMRALRLGAVIGDQVAVLSGLEEGDAILRAPDGSVRSGQYSSGP